MNSGKWRERQQAHVDKLEQDIWNQEARLRDRIAFGTDLVGRGLKMRPGPRKDELDMRTAEIDEKIAKLERQLDEPRSQPPRHR